MTPLADAAGRIFVTPSGTPAQWSAGLAYTADGRLCVTSTPLPNDRIQGGLRRSNDGVLVVGDGDISSRPYVFNAGVPTDKQAARAGVVIRQVDTTPAPSDPFVRGIRIGPRGGVYMTTAAINGLVSPVELTTDDAPTEPDYPENLYE